jgi:2-polyprenyl-3-methyl-5-hydroxy-6-metoxy-1,4-benzoquinol methylase
MSSWQPILIYNKGNKELSYQSKENTHFSGLNELVNTEKALHRYNNAIVSKFIDSIPPIGIDKNISILDFGAGIGTLAQIFRDRYGIIPDCIEIDPILNKLLNQNRFTSIDDINQLTKEYDVVYTSNVLEHIDNDLQTLIQLFSVIKPGGKILVYVPAFPILFSKMDERIGHFRRYTKHEIMVKVQKAGFVKEKIVYDDSLGFIVSLMLKVMGFHRPSDPPGVRVLQVYDKFVFPLSQIIDRLGSRFILGKNIYLVAKKPE